MKRVEADGDIDRVRDILLSWDPKAVRVIALDGLARELAYRELITRSKSALVDSLLSKMADSDVGKAATETLEDYGNEDVIDFILDSGRGDVLSSIIETEEAAQERRR